MVTRHLGESRGMSLGNFCILDSLRLLLVHSQVLRYLRKTQVFTVSDAFSGTVLSYVLYLPFGKTYYHLTVLNADTHQHFEVHLNGVIVVVNVSENLLKI